MARFLKEEIPYEENTRIIGIEFDSLSVSGLNGTLEALTPVFECDDGTLIQVDLTPRPSVEWYEPDYDFESNDGRGVSANRIQQILVEKNAARYRGDGTIVPDEDGNYTEFESR